MRDQRKLAGVFKALSADTRLRIVDMLKGRSLCVGVIAARLGVSSAAISQHLRILREGGLVIAEKRGYYVHYRLDETTLRRWQRLVGELLSAGNRSKSLSDVPECQEGRCQRER